MAKSKKKANKITGPGGVPIQKMPEARVFHKARQIWVGRPKAGKTSTAAALATIAEEYGLEDEINPFFLLFEQGTGGVEVQASSEECECGGKDKECSECRGAGVKRMVLSTEEEITEWFEWAAASPFNPIVIDTGDAMWQTIADYVCVRLGIPNPTASDHGTAWVQIYDEFREKMSILDDSGKGIIVIMHVYMQEKRVRGGTISTATFNVSGKSRQHLAKMADQILYFDVEPDGETDKHTIISTAESGIEAGDRWHKFPPSLDRGKSPEEGAQAILNVFYDLGE